MISQPWKLVKNLRQIIPMPEFLCNNGTGATMNVYILFAGNPDQGILYVGQIFMEAAIEAGLHTACLRAISRGAVSQCTIFISDERIVRRQQAPPDVVILASRPAADLLEYSVRPDGLLIMNASQLQRPPFRHNADVILVPTDAVGAETDPVRATVALLGTLVALTDWFSPEDVLKIIEKSCKDEGLCRAFQYGASYVEEIIRVR